jgi:hypothetical protein
VYQRLPRLKRSEIDGRQEQLDTEKYAERCRPLAAPIAYSWNSRARAFDLLDAERQNRMAILSPWESRLSSGGFQDFERSNPNATAWEFLDRWGRIFSNNPGGVFYMEWDNVSLPDLDGVAVDLDRDGSSAHGWSSITRKS